MKGILSPEIMGRYANNMFIVLSSYALAKKLGFELRLPQDTLNPQIWPNYHHTFAGKIKFLDGTEYFQHRLEEKNHQNIELELSNLTKNVKLHGYLQKYTYFIDYIDEIRKLIDIEKKHNNNVCIHLRFGDYLGLSTHHTNLTYKYYKEAITIFTFTGYKIVVSDNIFMARELIKEAIRDTKYSIDDFIFYLSENQLIQDDFNMIVNSKFNIIANSSFSLLASILNPNPDKIVICPDESIWFGPSNKHLNVNGMIPTEYIRVKTI